MSRGSDYDRGFERVGADMRTYVDERGTRRKMLSDDFLAVWFPRALFEDGAGDQVVGIEQHVHVRLDLHPDFGERLDGRVNVRGQVLAGLKRPVGGPSAYRGEIVTRASFRTDHFCGEETRPIADEQQGAGYDQPGEARFGHELI